MKTSLAKELEHAATTRQPVSTDAALDILLSTPEDMPAIITAASAVRYHKWGNNVFLCSITNARSGACGEDCRFCAQSAAHNTEIDIYPMRSTDRIRDAYDRAAGLPINHFGVVTSGEALDDNGVETVCRAVRNHTRPGKNWCASLGSLTDDQLTALKQAGLKRFHHNLETSESFFPNVCSTHTFADRLAALRRARAAGLEICAGGILGLGESTEQRVEFAVTLAREQVGSIPLNFHVAIPGTPLDKLMPMRPLEILRTIAMFRLTNPEAEIKVCAGRCHLRDLQCMIFNAGATGMMIGPLLTIAGREVDDDLRMLKDLEMEPVTGE